MAVMLEALGAALAKDLRLLLRDRIGIVFLTLAPMIVISVAGVSLASLYGADPRGATAYVLPLVDEDGGPVGAAIRGRLAHESAITLRTVASRAEALALLEQREVGAALVIPAGTSGAQQEGRGSTLLLLTDPVKYLEIANVRGLVQELRHGIEEEARRRAAVRLGAAREAAEQTRAEFTRSAEEARRAIDTFRSALARLRDEIEERRRAAREGAERELRDELTRASAARRRDIAEHASAELAPVRVFVAALAESQRAFEEWLAAVREKAGRLADRMPAPPVPPPLPPALQELAAAGPDALIDRVVGPEGPPIELPALPEIALPPLPQPPRLELPTLPEMPALVLPGAIEIEEESATGAPRRLNSFDQNVPGFSVTFLLLGMLLGVSLALLDERDWGTFERLRSMPAPFSTVLVAKLLSRVLVGVTQMALLFAVGWAAFGISLGPQPWALLLPTAGIVFAGTAFGLVVAASATTREAVLPLGSIVIVTMAAVGGCWWPIDLEPLWMRSVALAFPTTWAMAAYNDLMIRRQGVQAAFWPTTILFGYASLYLVAGLWLFRRRELAGG
jgi:ABC-type multidrug transport system permease subunit